MRQFKFTEGDIIIFDDKFYNCRIAGEEESVFNEIYIGINLWCSPNPECKGLILPSDLSKFREFRENKRVKYLSDLKRFNDVIRNPVVGTTKTKSGYMVGLRLDIGAIKNRSKKLYEEYVCKLISSIDDVENVKLQKLKKKVIKEISK